MDHLLIRFLIRLPPSLVNCKALLQEECRVIGQVRMYSFLSSNWTIRQGHISGWANIQLIWKIWIFIVLLKLSHWRWWFWVFAFRNQWIRFLSFVLLQELLSKSTFEDCNCWLNTLERQVFPEFSLIPQSILHLFLFPWRL